MLQSAVVMCCHLDWRHTLAGVNFTVCSLFYSTHVHVQYVLYSYGFLNKLKLVYGFPPAYKRQKSLGFIRPVVHQ